MISEVRPPPADGAPVAPSQKIWTVGTLVYTTSGIVGLFAWLALGDFAWWMRERSVLPMSQWYLSQLETSSLLFSVLTVSLPAVIQFVVSPIISVKSDRHRGPRGRRIPFLISLTLLAMGCMLGLGLTPVLVHWLHGFGVVAGLVSERLIALGFFVVFWTGFEVTLWGSKPIFDGLVNDVVPRPLLGRFFALFRAVGLIDGMVFNYWVMGLVPAHFTLIMSIAGLVYGTAFVLVCLKIKEGDYPPPPPREDAPPLRRLRTESRRYIRECFTSRYYLSVFSLIMLAGLSFIPFYTFSIPYAKHLGVSMDLYGKATALTYLISLGLTFPLGWLADKFHPLRIGIVVLSLHVTLMVAATFLVRDAHAYLFVLVASGIVAGSYYTATASTLQQHLFPRNSFAQFSSASLIFDATARFCLAPVMGGIIDATGKNYRAIFVMGFVLTIAALGMAFLVLARFKKLGGPGNYVAPEPVAS